MKGSLVFRHQDGDLSFVVVDGVFHLSPSGMFSCSIACQRNDDLEFMSSPHFALLYVPVGSALRVGQVLTVEGQTTSEAIVEKRPLVHLYAGDHFSPWNARLAVEAVSGHEIQVCGSFITEDPNYYDERAKDTAGEFSARLRPVPLSQVWNPLS